MKIFNAAMFSSVIILKTSHTKTGNGKKNHHVKQESNSCAF